jgi:flagellar biogenesis protein FliO
MAEAPTGCLPTVVRLTMILAGMLAVAWLLNRLVGLIL